MKWLLDTDIVVSAIRKDPPDVLRWLLNSSPDELAISVVTIAELTYGAAKSRDPERTRALFEHFLTPYHILSFDRPAAERHGSLRYELRHQPIGERDLIIASIALANNLAVVTGNVREFGRVADLRLEDWKS